MNKISLGPATWLDMTPAFHALPLDEKGHAVLTGPYESTMGDSEAEAIGKVILMNPAKFGIEIVRR